MTSRIWRYALLAMAVTSLTGFSLIVAGAHSLSVLSDRFCQAVVFMSRIGSRS
jgi:membrane-associated phospholipid phosphatase